MADTDDQDIKNPAPDTNLTTNQQPVNTDPNPTIEAADNVQAAAQVEEQAKARATQPAQPTAAKGAGDAGAKKLAKAAGVDPNDVLSYNEERDTLVTTSGQKFRLGADGKTAIQLSGPVPEE